MIFKSATVGNVPASWTVGELRDFLSLITYGFTNPMPDADEGPWKLTAKDVVNGVINYSTARKTTAEAFKNKLTDKSRPKLNDVLLTKDGSIGRVAVVDRDGICINQSVALLRPNEKIDPYFLKYLLISPFYQQVMEGDSDGSTIKHIYITRVDKMEVAIPPLDEQRQILSVVGTLDDRINLLRETNATLEAIAQALFKSWFVDFDPVHANAGAQAPSLPPEIQALFPATFTDSPQGPIPEGWQVMPFGDFIERMSVGKKFDQKSALEEGSIPILDQGRSGIIGFHNETPGVKASLEEPVVVFANHTCYMRLITFDFSAIQNVLPFTGKSVDTVWAFYATKDRIKFSEYKGHWPDFAIEKSVVPPKTLTELYRSNVDSIIRSTRNNELQIEALSKLRDTLLPRLISGQLRLPEAEQAIAAITD